MNGIDYEDLLETLPTAELVRLAQEYVVLCTNRPGEMQSDAANVLDLLCAEFARRGKEKLYDIVRGSVVCPASTKVAHSPIEDTSAVIDYATD